MGGNSSLAFNAGFLHRDDPLLGSKTIRDVGNFDPPTAGGAGGFVRSLGVEEYCSSFLALFCKIMPHVDTQKGQIRLTTTIHDYYW